MVERLPVDRRNARAHPDLELVERRGAASHLRVIINFISLWEEPPQRGG
jgi:hypothetical protein